MLSVLSTTDSATTESAESRGEPSDEWLEREMLEPELGLAADVVV